LVPLYSQVGHQNKVERREPDLRIPSPSLGVPFYATNHVPYPEMLIAFVAQRCGLAPGSPVLRALLRGEARGVPSLRVAQPKRTILEFYG